MDVTLDTTAPTVASVVVSGHRVAAGAGDLHAGDVAVLTVNFSTTVNVSGGVPTLSLNDGGTAHYIGGSGTGALAFRYRVAAGQNTADLTTTGLSLNGATIQDDAGNDAILDGAATNPAGTLQIDTAITISGTTPSQAVIDHAELAPFANVSVADPNSTPN